MPSTHIPSEGRIQQAIHPSVNLYLVHTMLIHSFEFEVTLI